MDISGLLYTGYYRKASERKKTELFLHKLNGYLMVYTLADTERNGVEH